MSHEGPKNNIVLFPKDKTKEGREDTAKYIKAVEDIINQIIPRQMREAMIPGHAEMITPEFKAMSDTSLSAYIDEHCIKDTTLFSNREHIAKVDLMIACNEYLSRNRER